MIKMIVVEDMDILRDLLAGVLDAQLDIEVCATASNAKDALSLCKKHSPNVVLLDVCTENGASGIEAAAEIRAAFPDMKIVIFTGMPDLSFINEAKAAGANSFVYKNLDTKELISVIHSTASGYNTFPENRDAPKIADAELTEREMEILRLTCEGNDRQQIAQTLNLSESTVKTYIREILSKTGYSSIARLAVYAVSNGFIASTKR